MINAAPGVSVQPEVELEDGRSFREYKLKWFREDPISRMHFSTRGVVESVYKQWGASDLALLLDHVYYETPPMLAAVRSQGLDFSLIPDPKEAGSSDIVRDFSVMIPDTKRRALKQRLKQSAANYRVRRNPISLEIDENDEAAFQAMGGRD